MSETNTERPTNSNLRSKLFARCEPTAHRSVFSDRSSYTFRAFTTDRSSYLFRPFKPTAHRSGFYSQNVSRPPFSRVKQVTLSKFFTMSCRLESPKALRWVVGWNRHFRYAILAVTSGSNLYAGPLSVRSYYRDDDVDQLGEKFAEKLVQIDNRQDGVALLRDKITDETSKRLESVS